METSSEKNLICAVLTNAIEIYVGKRKSFSGAIEEIRRWFLNETEYCEDYFTFHHICEALDLDKEGLRRFLKLEKRETNYGT